ncbi:MAG: type II toxin-antitoxin system VapC family toxin [Candidatus Hydrogenedentota bacterium]
MVLVDTSVWVDHLRACNTVLEDLLNADRVATHPLVVGELACGNLQDRTTILRLLQSLPTAPVTLHREVLAFIETEALYGAGLGYIDINLLASALLGAIPLWTKDKRLHRAAAERGIAWTG